MIQNTTILMISQNHVNFFFQHMGWVSIILCTIDLFSLWFNKQGMASFSPVSILSDASSLPYLSPNASPWPEQKEEDLPSSESNECPEVVIESFLHCLLCGKEMRRPIMLPCLDNFCLDCLRDSHNQQQQNRDRQRRNEEEEKRERRRQRVAAGDDLSCSVPVEGGSPVPVRSRLGSSLSHVSSLEDSSDGGNTSITSTSSSSKQLANLFRCPLNSCHQVVRNVSLDDVEQLDNLSVNLPLQNIERTVSIKEELPHGHIKCDCGKVAVGVCYNKDCNNQPFCAECQKIHLRDRKVHAIAHPDTLAAGEGRNSITHDDDAVSAVISESSNGRQYSKGSASRHNTIAWKDLKQSDILCHHHGKPMNLYCYDHDEVICESCTFVNQFHRFCRRIEFAVDIYEIEKDTTHDNLANIEELHKCVQSAIKITKELVKALEFKNKHIKESINLRYDRLITQLHEHKEELLNKCDTLFYLKETELNEHLQMLNHVSESFVRCILFVSWFMGTALPSEFMMLNTQINQRLVELISTRSASDYQYSPVEDDCIFFREKNQFDMSNAIGRVYSTPSVKNFSLVRKRSSPLLVNRPVNFKVVVHDAIRNELFLSRSSMPLLHATLKHVDEEETSQGYVVKDRSSGRYSVMVYPNRSGKHELCVYHPMRPPYDKCYVGHRESYIITIHDSSLTSFPFHPHP